MATSASRPRIRRTRENYELARQMEAMLAQARNYRGAHLRRRPPSSTTNEKPPPERLPEEDGRGHPGSDVASDVASSTGTAVGDVLVGMDGVERVEWRRRVAIGIDEDEEARDDDDDASEARAEPAEPSDAGDDDSSRHDDLSRRDDVGFDGPFGGPSEEGPSPRSAERRKRFEEERRRFERDRRMTRERRRERESLFLEEHRGPRGVSWLSRRDDDGEAARDGEYDEDAEYEDEYGEDAEYVEPTSFRSLSEAAYYHGVDPEDELAMLALARELELRECPYPYEDEGSIAHLRALVRRGPRTPPPPIPEEDEDDLRETDSEAESDEGGRLGGVSGRAGGEVEEDDDVRASQPNLSAISPEIGARMSAHFAAGRRPRRSEEVRRARVDVLVEKESSDPAVPSRGEGWGRSKDRKPEVPRLSKVKSKKSKRKKKKIAPPPGPSVPAAFQPKRAWGVAMPPQFPRSMSSGSLESVGVLENFGDELKGPHKSRVNAAKRREIKEDILRSKRSTVEDVKSWESNPTMRKWLAERAEKEEKRRKAKLNRAQGDFEWVHERRLREKHLHTGSRTQETNLELHRQRGLRSCFKAWCTLAPSYVNRQLRRLLERAEEKDSSREAPATHALRTRAGIGKSGMKHHVSSANGPASASPSKVAAERRRFVRERTEAWAMASSELFTESPSSASISCRFECAEDGDDFPVLTMSEILEVQSDEHALEKENLLMADLEVDEPTIAFHSTDEDVKAAAVLRRLRR